MSKVTIKFFDKKAKEYVDDEVYLIDDGLGVCFQDSGMRWGVEHYFLQDCPHIEPHFFVNGERIDE